MYRFALLFACFLFTTSHYLVAQTDEDAFFIKEIYNTALTEGKAYDWLYHLSENIGGRLAGSPQAAAAVEYTKQVMDTLGMDEIRLQECMVPHWERGEKEVVRIVNSYQIGSLELKALSLGNSIGTGNNGLTAEVIEVQTLDELDSLGFDKVNGKIVFFNRPLDPTKLNTFSAYGGAADQRVFGASRAAKYGGVAALVRSLTTRNDDVPHTGVMIYEEGIPQVPAIAISTNDANLLSRLLKKESVNVYMRNTSRNLSKKKSYNVIGEIKGSEFPDEIILVGGHLDSWDVGGGAHDDGAGCVHALDVIQVLKRLNYKPKRTIRCVMFMNEENGQAGAIAYRDESDAKGEFHMAAIESDRGGFTPRGFTCDADKEIFEEKFRKITEWLPLLSPYGLDLKKGGSGADISRLKPQKGLLFGFEPDSQRYFDYHHTAIDRIDAVNKRELQMGVAAITSLIYLLDQYGI
jgi:hypothetical protein